MVKKAFNSIEFKKKLRQAAKDYDKSIKNNFDNLRKRVSGLEKEIKVLKQKYGKNSY